MQGVFSPVLDEQLGSLSSKHHQLAAILSIVKVELLAGVWPGGVGPFIQAPARISECTMRRTTAKPEPVYPGSKSDKWLFLKESHIEARGKGTLTLASL
jgi:hypothetical protein